MKFWRWDFSWFMILLCTLAYILNLFISTGIYDHSDGLAHFGIAHFAPQHLELFLDHWGKPLFTLLSAPFTLFGIKGVMSFNIILYVITARFLVLLGSRLQFRFLWIIPVLLASIPVYFQVVMGGLTEVLFATLLTVVLYLCANAKFNAAGFLLSFMLFSRSEAYFVLPLFALFFAFKKEWLAILNLLIVPLLMSLVGLFVFDDFGWMINRNPYVSAVEIYGTGPFWHFFFNRNLITGSWLWLGASAGLLTIIFQARNTWKDDKHQLLVLSAVVLLAVLVAHSWFWYKGLYGSFGLLRVMATVAPLFVLLFLAGLNWLAEKMVNPKLLSPIPMFTAFFTIKALLAHQPIAKKADYLEQDIQALAVWYENSEYTNNPNVWFMYPAIGYYLGIDNFDKLNSRYLWYLDRIKPSNSIREGGLIIYDSGQSPREGNTSIEQLEADPFLHQVFQVSNPAYGHELMVYTKVLPEECDTLVNEQFNSSRPLLTGRLQSIGIDEKGERFLKMVNNTHYMKVFTFWKEERDFWQAPRFEFWFEADEALEVYLSVVYKDGHEENVPWYSGEFQLPEFEKGVANISIALRNPHPERAANVYAWGLRKIADTAI